MEYLQAEFMRLRLLLQRRVLWLRQIWKRDLAQEFKNFGGIVITDADADALLQPSPRQSELYFYEQDPRAQAVTRAVQEQEAHIREKEQAMIAAGGPAPLDIITRLFQLGPFERDVLLLCLAPSVDSSFERLYGYALDDATQRYLTAGLAMELLATERGNEELAGTLWSCLSPDAPLVRFGLLHLDSSPGAHRASEALRINRRIADYLMGVNHLDERASFLLQRVHSQGCLSDDQERTVAELHHRVRSWSDREHMPLLQLLGPAGADSRAIACELCARCGLSLYSVDLQPLFALGADRQNVYRLLERESLLLPCAYYVDSFSLDTAHRSDTTNFVEFLNHVRSFVIVGSREPWQCERRVVTARLGRCAEPAQMLVWHADLATLRERSQTTYESDCDDAVIVHLVQQFQFSPQQIHRVVREAYEVAALRTPDRPVLEAADLWATARMQAARAMDGLAERIVTRRSFDELVLPAEQLAQIREVASQAQHRVHVYERWGFGAKLSRGRGIAALFAGPSGTGKTMAAEVLANELDLDLYRIDLASVMSKYIGETEKNLRRVFDAAEESGAILFFDEADSLFGKRSEVRDSHDRYANIEINYLLQRMEDYRGLAILATNRKSLLDQAFLRRLRFLVDFPFPSTAERVRIWRGAFPPQAEREELDYQFLGRMEIAGGNISNIALNAAFLAAGQGTSIQMHHIAAAARREYAKIDKLMVDSEFGRYATAGPERGR
jgi:hypothetical protein